MFGLKQRDIDIIKSMGEKFPGITSILIYGSRARGNYFEGSDVDLALVGDITSRDRAWIWDALNEELPTPYFYDVVHFDTICNDDFKQRIEEEGKIIYEKLHTTGSASAAL